MLRRLSRVVLFCTTVLMVSSSSWAQVARPIQANPGWGNNLSQAVYWLGNEQVVKELEIVPDQKEKLAKLRGELQMKISEAYKSINFNDIAPEDRTAKYYEVLNRANEDVAKEVENVLLPHQLKRLKQIMTQMRMAQLGYGGAATLGGDDLASELGITDEQLEALKKKELEVREEMQKKTQEFYKQLQADAREQLLDVLTPAQRKKLTEILGEKFEWNWQQPGGVGQVRGNQSGEPAEKK